MTLKYEDEDVEEYEDPAAEWWEGRCGKVPEEGRPVSLWPCQLAGSEECGFECPIRRLK